jgi:hypothetical protein
LKNIIQTIANKIIISIYLKKVKKIIKNCQMRKIIVFDSNSIKIKLRTIINKSMHLKLKNRKNYNFKL